jgi:DNA-binding LacI/PurR family transcriptional regulator
VLVRDITNPLMAEIAKWVAVVSAKQGLSTLVSLDADTDTSAERALDDLIAHRVSGVIMVGAPYEKPAIARAAVRLPSVYIGRLLKVVKVDSVTTDHIQGAGLAIDYLVSVGCRRISHIDGDASPGAERMIEGYREAMVRNGLSQFADVVSGGHSVDAGAAAARVLFSRRRPPEAVFACSDLAAIGVLNEAAKHRISVPDQLSIIGYDDVTLAGSETLALTTIHQSPRDLAAAGVDALLRRLKEPRSPIEKRLVPPRLVIRRSARSPQLA